MDGERFDRWTRLFGERLSRRQVGGMLLALGVAGTAPVGQSAAKPKNKKCKGDATRCGKRCVDTRTNARNCGGCGIRCGHGVACSGGHCGARCRRNQIRCGDLCVDPQTDDNHCGRCDNTCGDAERCQGGSCVSTGCGADEFDCGGGRCIPDDPNWCCNQDDCGGSDFINDLVCQNDRCACKTPGEGICRRLSTGGGTCDVCCGDGSGQCPRDYVCRTDYTTPTCDCPSGYEHCLYSEYGTCSVNQSTDSAHCGINCINCATFDPGSSCCGGFCMRGCRPGFNGTGCLPGDPCGAGCEPCDEDKLCCNQGPGTAPVCVISETGFCP